ncbi:quercetin dioxygenase-like cupin family protein [Pseudomonas sp. JAI111]|jgi:quercetin dioxygenase-like cupin family protein|uniref:AraC family ligand binding domain-containing protein n=1 Tax=Pseudomonas sp. JAI111 TaxID=2735913 RepID=UPI00216850D2|nr:AraC family ligand binding domain-containing protein [Pseudomonas sp. JAI111]MCS3839331.1 quercetin dioxygenase-like cupin family protein [Pseudomonas sp. JAI111]
MEVISRSDIAPLNSVVVNGALHDLGVVKIFSQHPALAQFIPSKSEVALSWVRLEKDQELSVHQHPEASLILICDGSGKTLGDTERNIEAGDMVLVPPHSRHGFKGTNDGFWALSIQFNGKALYENTLQPNVDFKAQETVNAKPADGLLKDNEGYLESFRNSRLLSLINSPSIDQPEVRERLLDCLQTWSDMFQNLLHIRVAMTLDPAHKKIALEHLVEELGHNNNLRNQRHATHSPIGDAAFLSTMEWFRHQMLYKNDMVKTLLMHIVLEGSGEIFHSEAARVFTSMPHFQEHGEDDGSHVSMGIELLNQASPKEIEELRETLSEGWNMITLLCDRFADIACADYSHRAMDTTPPTKPAYN